MPSKEQLFNSGAPPERFRVALDTQSLSCWALHASDDQYVAIMRTVGETITVLHSVQLRIEDAMGLEGMVATAIYISTGESLFTDNALQCLADEADAELVATVTACSHNRQTEHWEITVEGRAVDYPVLWENAIALSCWAVHGSDREFLSYRRQLGLTESAEDSAFPVTLPRELIGVTARRSSTSTPYWRHPEGRLNSHRCGLSAYRD